MKDGKEWIFWFGPGLTQMGVSTIVTENCVSIDRLLSEQVDGFVRGIIYQQRYDL
jgi:hypothetical protein